MPNKTTPVIIWEELNATQNRVDYFFTRTYLKADSNFNARYVRLSFERQAKRYWLVWDATTVGGLLGDSQRALVR